SSICLRSFSRSDGEVSARMDCSTSGSSRRPWRSPSKILLRGTGRGDARSRSRHCLRLRPVNSTNLSALGVFNLPTIVKIASNRWSRSTISFSDFDFLGTVSLQSSIQTALTLVYSGTPSGSNSHRKHYFRPRASQLLRQQHSQRNGGSG